MPLMLNSRHIGTFTLIGSSLSLIWLKPKMFSYWSCGVQLWNQVHSLFKTFWLELWHHREKHLLAWSNAPVAVCVEEPPEPHPQRNSDTDSRRERKKAAQPEMIAKLVSALFFFCSFALSTVQNGTASKSSNDRENPAVYSGIMLVTFLCKQPHI